MCVSMAAQCVFGNACCRNKGLAGSPFACICARGIKTARAILLIVCPRLEHEFVEEVANSNLQCM